MKKTVQKTLTTLALIVAMMTAGAAVVQAQVNMNYYMTLTVKKGEKLRLDFKAASDGTPVRIVSGSNTQDITVGTSWIGRRNYTSDGTTMTIYGNVTEFDCENNDENITSLNASNNTALTYLYCGNNQLSSLDVSRCTALTTLDCSNNNFSTVALDAIYCALPDRSGKEEGMILPVFNASSGNHATVLATTKGNATSKNWKVLYSEDDTDIPATTGNYMCVTSVKNMPALEALRLYPNPVENA